MNTLTSTATGQTGIRALQRAGSVARQASCKDSRVRAFLRFDYMFLVYTNFWRSEVDCITCTV